LPYIQIFVCRQCQDAPCLTVCPEDAIVKEDNVKGTICVEVETCAGCGLCVKACPFGGIQTEPVSKRAFKCELCEGEPACVDFCPSDALSFVDQEPFYAENNALQMKGISVFKRKKTDK
jgi:Fe-S-cluster-containing hydrogenase component 2